MKRRKFLKIAGSGGVILAAGAGGFIATRTPHAALEAWKTAANSPHSDPMRRALSYAILAPNPHNRQPWIVAINSDTDAVLYCDKDRLLPATDPFDRQIVIGLGCFIELFSLAAKNDSYHAEITLFPDGEPVDRLDERPIARLRLIRGAKQSPDPLFAQVLDRRTNRNAYDLQRNIPQAALQKLSAAANSDVIAGTIGEGAQRQALRSLTQQALRAELLDTDAFAESINLMRIGRSEIEANPDGIYLGGALLESLGVLGVLTREKMADPESSSFQVGLNMADEQALTATGFVWINTTGNSRNAQIAAGRSYMRIALQASALGLAMQPMSQALQEYAAMSAYFDQVHEILAEGRIQRVQMLARLGYADDIRPAPRWPLETRLT
jgi:nitroreductase